MEYVRDKDGRVLNTSRNLAGVRRYMSLTRSPVKVLDLAHVGQGEGMLSILWENGANFQCTFASFDVMSDWVDRWRNAWGSPLTIDGKPNGTVHGK